MKKKIMKLCKMINSDKKTRILVIIFVMLSFIFTLGYSLSLFTARKEASVVNINVNGLVFNLTTNAGESDDRILKLAAGMTESFDVNITNLNNINVKYELLYDVCKDVNCKEKLNDLPANVQVALNMLKTKTANGLILPGSNNAKKISLITINNTENDYYIKLNMNAGYEWNELELANNFNYQLVEPSMGVDVIAYVDGVKTNAYPASCNYVAKVKAYDGTTEVVSDNTLMSCDRYTNKWKFIVEGFVDRVVVEFFTQPGAPPFTYTGEYEIVDGDTIDWKIRFLSSGTLTFTGQIPLLDIFLVGGGGGGHQRYTNHYNYGGGGGGGYTTTKLKKNALPDTEYPIVVGIGGKFSDTNNVGNNGGDTSALGEIAAGGKGAKNWQGGNGGSGGGGSSTSSSVGGTDGGNGTGNGKGIGQGTTTREFGEADGTLYASGGCGGGKGDIGAANTGDGGRGSYLSGGTSGFSGIVILRAHQE